MVEVGFHCSSEDHPPQELVAAAVAAERAGLRYVSISDHYHPWTSAQGHSAFVWSVLGAIAQATSDVVVTTAVTAPIIRIHPAIVAHAVATTAVLFEGRFRFGVGSCENLNEHVLGDPWPQPPVRLRMLEEAIEIMRQLWTGEEVSFDGEHYLVEDAKLWDVPEGGVPVYVSAFGPKAVELAARVGDGYVGTSPEAELVQGYKDAGGQGPAVALAKACWMPDEASARQRAHEVWRNAGIPGQLSQELRLTQYFEQAAELVTEDMVAESFPMGPDPAPYVETLQQYADAGYDVVHVHSIGPDQEGFARFLAEEVAPKLG